MKKVQLRALIDELASQFSLAVDGKFDTTVKIDSHHPTVEKLQLLINTVLDTARRSLLQAEAKTQELAAKTRDLELLNDRMQREIEARIRAEEKAQ
jgi:hypothetical protein